MQLRWDEKASVAQVAAIAAQMDSAGFCRLDDYISPEELQALVALAEAAVDRTGGEYVAFEGPDEFAGTAWDRMNSSPSVQFLCEILYRHSTGGLESTPGFYQLFRCLKGKSSRKNSLYFHFDSYAVTILIPIVIPRSGLPGNLIVFPSLRPIRKTYWQNVIDKVVREPLPIQILYRVLARSPRTKAVSIKLKPGSAVLFWGYRSLHTNEPCDPDKLRATALLHFGNPHLRSRHRPSEVRGGG